MRKRADNPSGRLPGRMDIRLLAVHLLPPCHFRCDRQRWVIFVAGSLHLGQLARETGPFGCASGAIFALRTPDRAEIPPLSLKQSLLAFLCCLQRVVSPAQAPSVRRVELGVRCVLSFLLVIREHAVLRRSLCATLTALIDPLAAPSGAIADGLSPYPVFRAQVMRIGLLGLRLDRSGVQSRDPGAQRVQVRHRSRCFVRRDLRKAHCARPFEGSR
jgi:hypothetical protein